jgi:hypothetical protein
MEYKNRFIYLNGSGQFSLGMDVARLWAVLGAAGIYRSRRSGKGMVVWLGGLS